MSLIPTENGVSDAVGPVVDTDLDKTLGELKSIKEINIDGPNLSLAIEIAGPGHYIKEYLVQQCLSRLETAYPGIAARIDISERYPVQAQRKFLSGVKNIIAVASGKGGVGKSSITSNLAAALSLTGASVGILDGDVYGPSQPTMFGMPQQPLFAETTADGKTVVLPHEQYGIKLASMGFILNRDEAAIVRGPMLAGYFSMLFEQIEWGELDYLLFDLPPGTGDIQLTLTQKIPMTGAVIVTTPQEISVADVRRGIAMFRRVNVDILGIIENMSYFVPPDMPEKKYYIFGSGGGSAVARENDIEFLGEVPLDMRMREGNDNGMPVVLSQAAPEQKLLLIEISRRLVSQIRKHNYLLLNKPELKIIL